MRVSEYEYYDARANQEHLANQDDELTNEMAQRFYDAVMDETPHLIQKLNESELNGIWNGLFKAAKSENLLR
ncbi:hypothetical protein DYB39_09315 [Providencia rettgeri]|jgi:RecA-family ATPase|uniref:hypothetical protein n=1 Tax=Providencia rettgeri TaxID=587 RepID=UPI0005B54703|nr:hypothetical protein [Providencia rettgeri]ELR5210103.1 hypothetical protein [Providencia rettgeri]RFT11155.1 hypothetical protein DYB39_09315 [Providencia rettgeri]